MKKIHHLRTSVWLGAITLATVASSALALNGPLFTPAIPGVVAGGLEIKLVKDDFASTEGPIPLNDGSLIFTETKINKVTHIAADGSTSTFLDNSNGTNSLSFAANGDLYAVQVLKPRVGIVFPPEHVKVLADNFEGAPFVRPNDIVVDRQGNVYFTDSGNPPLAPGATPAPVPTPAPAKPAVYRITAAGALQRLDADIERPNGIQLSPDEKILYVANTAGEYVLAYDIAADGTIGPRRNFAKLDGFKKTETGPTSGADGLAVDAEGRVFVATTIGVQVFSKTGVALGNIPLPKQPQNLAFAGPDKKSLFVVGRGAVYKIPVLTSGVVERAK